jgi:hypothetical protein
MYNSPRLVKPDCQAADLRGYLAEYPPVTLASTWVITRRMEILAT